MWSRVVAAAARRATQAGRARAVFAVGLGMGAAAVGAQVAEAKPKDVPTYLMPYYLTSLKKRFNRFARERDEDGSKAMSTADFVRSVLCMSRTATVPQAALRDLSKLFKLVDNNADGKLSFSEYSLFMLFLTAPRDQLSIAFRMFDTDEKDSLTKDQFMNVCQATSNDPSQDFNLDGGLGEYLFGQNASDRMTYDEFMEFLTHVRSTVWRAEFKQYDPHDTGLITPESFAKLITSGMLGSHLPFYIVDNMRKLKRRDNANDAVVPLSVWTNFNNIAIHERLITPLMNYYTLSGRPLTKKDFRRVIQVAMNPLRVPVATALEQETDLVFAIFDRDGNGTLECDEFLALARSRDRYNAIPKKRNPDAEKPIFQHIANCVMEAAQEKASWL
eukprot:TRINITY_DN10822_c0_g1_i1.p1 TRINITY_DN10822_c0_g1~~TRINITY_DN10822_c0_g1_i1.p1  ORF type:complete len:388 (+),score=145.93 TRINITY_DN10822_c0_g1_i1:104-1267(+)